MSNLSKEEIEKRKRERMAAKRLMIDKLRFWVGVFSVPTILIMACMLIGAAYYLGESQLAVVTGLISTITIGLINVLNGMVVPPPPEDQLAVVAKDLVHHMQEQNKSAEISMDKNHIKIGGNGMKIATSNDKDLVWGNDKKPIKKGKK